MFSPALFRDFPLYTVHFIFIGKNSSGSEVQAGMAGHHDVLALPSAAAVGNQLPRLPPASSVQVSSHHDGLAPLKSLSIKCHRVSFPLMGQGCSVHGHSLGGPASFQPVDSSLGIHLNHWYYE